MTDKKRGRTVRCFNVYKNKTLVLKIEDRPGVLLSTAPAPPDPLPPANHPFINAQAFDAASENELRKLLLESKNFDEYLKALAGAGYKTAPCE